MKKQLAEDILRIKGYQQALRAIIKETEYFDGESGLIGSVHFGGKAYLFTAKPLDNESYHDEVVKQNRILMTRGVPEE